MILPLGDNPNPPGVPVVTYALILANCAVYVFLTLPLGFVRPDPLDPLVQEYLGAMFEAMSLPPSARAANALFSRLTEYDLLVFQWGFRPVAPQIPTLFTAMFLHSGFLHLAGNMLFLWIYGDNVEYRLGRVRFLAAYLGTGVAATLFHTLFAGQALLPLLGASGAISGVLGVYFLWFPRNRVRLWVMLFPFFMQVVYAPARWVLGFYVLVDNLLPLLVAAGTRGGGVAYGAHIGGFFGGKKAGDPARALTAAMLPFLIIAGLYFLATTGALPPGSGPNDVAEEVGNLIGHNPDEGSLGPISEMPDSNSSVFISVVTFAFIGGLVQTEKNGTAEKTKF